MADDLLPVVAGFDYSQVDAIVAGSLREAADRIQALFRKEQIAIIETGTELLRVKGKLVHGQFGRWVDAEFGLSVSTAERYMRVADRLAGKIGTVTVLQPTTLYQLSAKSTPDAVVEEVVGLLAAGEPLRDTEIKSRIDAAKWAAKLAEKKTLGEAVRARRRGKMTSAEREAEDAQRQREEAKQQREEAARQKAAQAAVAMLIDCLYGGQFDRFKTLFEQATPWRFRDQLLQSQSTTRGEPTTIPLAAAGRAGDRRTRAPTGEDGGCAPVPRFGWLPIWEVQGAGPVQV